MKKIPKYEFQNPLKIEFELTSLTDIYKKSKQKLHIPHRQDFYGLFYFTNSIGKHYVDFKEYNINKGDVFLISNEQVHYFQDIKNADGKVILFTASFFDNDILLYNIFEKAEQKPVLSLNTTQRSYWDNLIHQIEFVYSSERILKTEILKNYLSILLFEIHQYQHEEPITNNIDYQRFVTFKKDLKKHCREHKKVRFYAEKQNISPKTLNLAVRKIVDNSAKEYISNFILLSAKRLLINSNLTTAEIAYELGFKEPTNFTKFFKKKEMTSPLMFRKEHNK